MKAIEIEELRISSNGEYLEFIINCPVNYFFTVFDITVDGNTYSIADSLFKDLDNNYLVNNHSFSGAIDLLSFGITSPKIYEVYLKAVCAVDPNYQHYIDDPNNVYTITDDGFVMNLYGSLVLDLTKCTTWEYAPEVILINGQAHDYDTTNGTIGNKIDYTDKYVYLIDDHGAVIRVYDPIFVKPRIDALNINVEDEIEAHAYISDISQAYKCIADDMLALNSKCPPRDVLDRIIKNYLMVYAHLEALRYGNIQEAEKLFSLIDNCFTTPCGNYQRSSSCGCSK